jgi:hypothetical protein
MAKIDWAIKRGKKELTGEDKSNIIYLLDDCAKNPKNSKGFIRTMCSMDFPIKATVEFISSLENCVCDVININSEIDTYDILIAQNYHDLNHYFD